MKILPITLREITTSLMAEARKLAHLGVNTKIGRSTLAVANNRRPESIFEAIYHGLLRTNTEITCRIAGIIYRVIDE